MTETAIADAVAALLERASHGPTPAGTPEPKVSKRSRRIAARTRAATPARQLPHPAALPTAVPDPDTGDEDGDADSAEVVPLPVFDAREEATKWW